ncbi:MAG: NAD-dependent epimerase/dehydratase family protein [Candidatus Aminicenantes bacterium]|nr:NAD-dependent epimerase/dehydratase family protein [Candidatus Aminicenantes bacterium]
MKAFLTGASGFIGRHLARELLRRCWTVTALSRRRPPVEAPGLRHVRGDIADRTLLEKELQGADALFHLASSLGSALIPRAEFFRVNAHGTRTVLEAAAAAGVKIVIHFSTAGVLGHVRKGDIADEDYPLRPRDIYDRSKLEGEMIALEYARMGLDVRVIRPGWVYGPEDRRTFKLVRAVARGRLILPGSGRTLQTPVHVSDLTDGTFLCHEFGRRGEIYHLAGEEALSVRDMTAAIARAAGRKPPRLRLPLLPVKIGAWLMGGAFRLFKREAPINMSRLAFFIHPKPLDSRKATLELGYRPKVKFEEGMRRTVRWYRDEGWL